MGQTRRGFVTGGSWCVDRNKLVEYWPQEDQIVEILGEEMRGGGSGCNFAVDMRRLDPEVPVETIALVGDDSDGRFLQAEADANGIDRTQMRVTGEAPTQYTDAFGSRRSGRRTHIYNQGSGALLTPDHFDFAQTSGAILHLGLPGVHRRMDSPWPGSANGWEAVLKKAKAAGLTTNLELASIAPDRLAALARPCLPHLDHLVVNDVEIGAIAEVDTVRDGTTDIGACIAAGKAVLQGGPMRLVAVHFPAGAVVATREGRILTRPSVRVPPEAVAAANGAGDAFAAGFLYGIYRGWPLEEGVALAHAAAAASLRGLTTTDTVVAWRDCLALAEGWGWRDPLPVSA